MPSPRWVWRPIRRGRIRRRPRPYRPGRRAGSTTRGGSDSTWRPGYGAASPAGPAGTTGYRSGPRWARWPTDPGRATVSDVVARWGGVLVACAVGLPVAVGDRKSVG